jgi:hypothetical protein
MILWKLLALKFVAAKIESSSALNTDHRDNRILRCTESKVKGEGRGGEGNVRGRKWRAV